MGIITTKEIEFVGKKKKNPNKENHSSRWLH